MNISALRVLFFGLGNMGWHIASHLRADGGDVIASFKSAQQAERWSRGGGAYTLDPVTAVADRNVVITCVGDDDDLRDIFGDAFVHAIPSDAIVIDHTTASPGLAIRLSQLLAKRHQRFVDAPMSGGHIGAASRTLSIMVGANDEPTFRRAEAVMSTYASRILHMGQVGAGQLCKMANQLCVAGTLAGVAEAIGLAIKSDLDPQTVVAALSGGAAMSWQLEHRSPIMLNATSPPGFTVRLMEKDLLLATAQAHDCGLNTPVASAVLRMCTTLHDRGLGNEDVASLVRVVLNEL